MRYMIVHSLPKGCTRSDVEKLSKSSLTDPIIKGYRSFLNLSTSKGYCLIDAPDKASLVNWLKSNNLTYDDITEIELEGYEGKFVETAVTVGTGV